MLGSALQKTNPHVLYVSECSPRGRLRRRIFAYSQKIYTPESFIELFLTENLTRLFLSKEVKPSLSSKNDKTSNFFLITCFRSYNCTLSLKPTVGKFVFLYFVKNKFNRGRALGVRGNVNKDV